MKSMFWAILGFALAGCTTVTVVEGNKVEEAVGNSPQFNVKSSVPVGEVLFSQFRYWRKTGYVLRDSANISIGGGQVQVSSGDFLVKSIVEGQPAYCTEKPAFKMIIGGKTACFTDLENKGLLKQVKVASDVMWWSSDLANPLAYASSEIVVPRQDAMKRELIYQGISKGVLRLTYREYFNDMARPAFFQDVTYDVSIFPTEITFKSVRLRILDAGNKGIEYQALSGFQ
ncbi:hypothetical protein [Duganella vulcania]|uniref:Uncharacterized protein n=1 Tax=Duganella vulcania TaxID=2692166 RepID=A0A845GW33_9BURK|nr:hypothetical protein [Duganella vulcania]MYM96877.1 hypothetical protein [Duganella vulcania]